MIRFLATGDLQCHAWKQFSYTRKDGMNSRLYNCLRVFDILLEEAQKRDITKILINGDVFEDNAFIDVEVYNGVYNKLERLYRHGMEVVINLGNHDVLKINGGILHALRAFRRVATIIEKPTLVWKTLMVVPWTPDHDGLKDTISKIDSNGGKMALVLHCGVQGATTGPTSYLARNPIKLRDVRMHDFLAVILSDYHTSQQLYKNVWYLGSPLQHSFGEIHRPCIWEIDLNRRSYSAKKIYTNLPLFTRLSIRNIRDLRRKRKELDRNYVRLEIPGDVKISDSEIEKYSRGKFLVQIEHRNSEERIRSREKGNVKTLEPEEAIALYAGFHSNRESLVRLGNKLYKGEL